MLFIQKNALTYTIKCVLFKIAILNFMLVNHTLKGIRFTFYIDLHYKKAIMQGSITWTRQLLSWSLAMHIMHIAAKDLINRLARDGGYSANHLQPSMFSFIKIIEILINCYIPESKVRGANKGAHLGPTGPWWAPFWPHELCYAGYLANLLNTNEIHFMKLSYKCFCKFFSHQNAYAWQIGPFWQDTLDISKWSKNVFA